MKLRYVALMSIIAFILFVAGFLCLKSVEASMKENNIINTEYLLHKLGQSPTMAQCTKVIFAELEDNEGFIKSTQLPVRKP